MFGIAATRGRYDGQTTRHLSAWARDYLRKAALADLGCAVAGVFTAAQLRFGNDVTATYVALSLALPVLWIAALWLAGGYDVRFIGTGSDEFRKVLNAGVSLTAAIAIFSYAVNIELSRSYLVIALPSVTLFDLVARYAIRKRLHRLRASGRCLLSVGLNAAGRSASGHPGRGREVCRACPSAAGGQARPYRSVAGQRAIGSVLG
jgi:hypothetical protein